jgi:hypothetical protein
MAGATSNDASVRGDGPRQRAGVALGAEPRAEVNGRRGPCRAGVMARESTERRAEPAAPAQDATRGESLLVDDERNALKALEAPRGGEGFSVRAGRGPGLAGRGAPSRRRSTPRAAVRRRRRGRSG